MRSSGNSNSKSALVSSDIGRPRLTDARISCVNKSAHPSVLEGEPLWAEKSRP
jgi:hypothetical protein